MSGARLRRVGARALACGALALAVHIGDAGAQGTPAIGSPYRPGIDVTDYEVRLELPDTGAFIRGDVTIALRRAPAMSTLRLDLVDALRVREVWVDGRPVTFARPRGEIDVPLASARGDSMAVRVRYDGAVTDGLIVRKDRQGRWTWFSDNWPDRARQWLPTVDHPSDKATVTFIVRAPVTRTVVSNGTLLGVTTVPGPPARSETRWRESHPIPTYLMVIGAGPLARVELPPGPCIPGAVHACVAQQAYAMPEHREWLTTAFAAAPRIVSFFEELVAPFPYEKLAHLQSATKFGGMENASAIFYADEAFTTRMLRESLIAHETAHQWFGDAVTEREWSDLWLSEGFATYFAALWTQRSQGDAALRTEMRSIRQQILDDSVVMKRPVLDTAQTDYLALLNANSYQKGGYVLHMLRQRLGDSAFFGGVRAYYLAHRDGNATTNDLRTALEMSSGQALGAFFDQWLRREGVPELRVGWAYDASNASVTVFVSQDRDRLYDVPLRLRVTDREGTVHDVLLVLPAEPRLFITLPGRFSGPPRQLVADPDEELLGRIVRL